MTVMRVEAFTLPLNTGPDVSLHDITAEVRSCLAATGIRNGFVVVTSQHTTTAVAINEYEVRLLEDVKAFLNRLIPPGDNYRQNDIHLRDCPADGEMPCTWSAPRRCCAGIETSSRSSGDESPDPGGQPKRLAPDVVTPIQAMGNDNVLWGAERIRGELLKLGIRVSKRTIQKYTRQARPPGKGSQSWNTFIANHSRDTWACDFLQLYDVLFRPIFAF